MTKSEKYEFLYSHLDFSETELNKMSDEEINEHVNEQLNYESNKGRKMKKKKRLTNIQFLKQIAEISEYGQLKQLFIMAAMDEYANKIAKSKTSDYPERWFINPEAWIGVAKELQSELNERAKQK